ncbi:MAG: hypothetical protein KY467_00990 [Gemmatimonadetes bacterium]|nr:hypothetical protein [Gemmatimonadota bacterium]
MTAPGETPRFVVCLRNDGWPVCLQVRKVYRVLPDACAARSGWIRVVDETDEDYLYPAASFHALELRDDIGRALADAVRGPGQIHVEQPDADPPRIRVRLGTRHKGSRHG